VSWVPSTVSASPALASGSCRPMVTTTDAGTPPTDGLVVSLEEPGAGLFQRIMEPLHRRPPIRDLDDIAGLVFDAAGSRCGERVQDGVQLGTDGVGEPACARVRAAAAVGGCHLHRTALFALVWYAVPELHASIVFEHVFDEKLFS